MGNTCQLPLLTPNIPEIGAGRVKSATASACGRPFRKVLALFSTIYRSSPQDVHSSVMLSSCGKCRFGCRVEDTRELPVIDCNL
jgi:hypothetical protein